MADSVATQAVLLAGDGNLSNPARLLRHAGEKSGLEVFQAPFGSMMGILIDEGHEVWKQRDYDAVVIWAQPRLSLKAFNRLAQAEEVSDEELLEDAEGFARLLRGLAQHQRNVFVPVLTDRPQSFGMGMLEYTHGFGLNRALDLINQKLRAELAQQNNVYFLDTNRWLASAGKDSFSYKLWYLSKTPYSNAVYESAARDILSALDALAGRSRKLIIVDLDDTLWGGIVGDDGMHNLKIGGHDAVGEAFADFQHGLLALKRRGVLLAIVSKNDEETALEAIDAHPEMVLRRNDFAGWRINWDDKAENIYALLEELNLGPESAVFIDDNPVERDRVSRALPKVLVPDWPKDKLRYRQTLESLTCFNVAQLSEEDAGRSRMYVNERERSELKRNIDSMDDWLASLDMKLAVESLAPGNLARAAQLMQRTNQFNLATRRMNQAELESWANRNGREVLVFRVTDRFGDSGIVGLASLEREGDTMTVVDFLMSCRVMGRRVEYGMLHVLVGRAARAGARQLRADFIPTAKNKPCLEFWSANGFERTDGGDAFTWDVKKAFELPAHLELVGESS